jgi:hypothetical protein
MSSYCTIKTNKSKRVACRHQQFFEYRETRKFYENYFFALSVALAPPFTPLQAHAGRSQPATHRVD